MKKNKLVVIIGVLAIILIIVGIVMMINLKKGTSNFPLFESDFEYLEYEGKKIYFAQKIEDFVLQFKGLGCKLENDNLSIEIDSINSEEHDFYKLSNTDHATSKVVCVVNNNKLSFSYLISSISDLEVYEWDISYYYVDSVYGSANLVVDGKKLFMGYDRNLEAKAYNELSKIIPDNYIVDGESYATIDLITYTKDATKYQYMFSDQDEKQFNNLLSIMVTKN